MNSSYNLYSYGSRGPEQKGISILGFPATYSIVVHKLPSISIDDGMMILVDDYDG